jgi:hypothetical protein
MMRHGSLHYRNGCGFPGRGTGKNNSFLCPFLVSLVNISLTIGEKMQGIARDFLGVTREAGRADEQQATFQNRKNSTVEHSVRVLVPCKDVVFSDWRPVRNERQRLHPAVALPRTRTDPAPCIPGAAA